MREKQKSNENQSLDFFNSRSFDNVSITKGLFLKPEYLLHPDVSGNKFRKLKYNLLEAQHKGHQKLLTFGGAFSNHIAAVASAGKQFGFKTIGVIRGEELAQKIGDNPTLTFASKCGMELSFISRELYREKSSENLLQHLKDYFGDFYLIPEGGTNHLAIKGCEEILSIVDEEFDYICCAVGTGGTISGLINSSLPHQKVLGFPALKGDFLGKEVEKWAQKPNWELVTGYDFGGYAKINTALISFVNWFKVTHDIPLDPIYTGKMMYGIFDLMKSGYFKPNDKILAIHTGGLQGIEGMNLTLRRKNLPQIVY